jgi:hypothetical protein
MIIYVSTRISGSRGHFPFSEPWTADGPHLTPGLSTAGHSAHTGCGRRGLEIQAWPLVCVKSHHNGVRAQAHEEQLRLAQMPAVLRTNSVVRCFKPYSVPHTFPKQYEWRLIVQGLIKWAGLTVICWRLLCPQHVSQHRFTGQSSVRSKLP